MFKRVLSRPVIAVFALAVLVGLIYSLTPLMIWRDFRNSGERFILAQFKTYRDSIYTYIPRAREVYEGHFPPSELFADKQVPTIQNFLPTLLFSSFIALWGGNINIAYLSVQFFFSGIIFLLLYFLGWTLWRSRPWAIFLGLVGTLTPIITKLPFYKWNGLSEFTAFFVNNFIPFVRTQFDQLYLARVDEPLLTYPIYFLAILAFVIFWKKPSRVSAILAGAATGLIYYTYFHHWVYFTVVVGYLLIYAAIFRKKDPELWRNYLWLMAALCIVVAPYFINYFQFESSPIAQDFIYREGVAYGRSIGISGENLPDYLVYLALGLAAYFSYWKTNRKKAVLLFGMILAMFTVWNIQLVIGYSPVPSFYQRSISPVIFLIIFDLLFNLVSRLEISRPQIKKVAIITVAVLSLLVVVKKVVNIVSIARQVQPHLLDYYKFPSDLVSSWDWMNKNLPYEPKIISPSTITSLYLITYTSARPFLPTAYATLLSMKEIEDRYLAAHKIFGIKSDILRQRLDGKMPENCSGYECFPDAGSNLNDSLGHIYGNYLSSRYAPFENWITITGSEAVKLARKNKVDELVARYGDLSVNWSSVDADYVYVGPWEKGIGVPDLSRASDLKLVYRNPLVEIYKIQH